MSGVAAVHKASDGGGGVKAASLLHSVQIIRNVVKSGLVLILPFCTSRFLFFMMHLD